MWLNLATVRAGCLDFTLAVRRGEHNLVAWPQFKDL